MGFGGGAREEKLGQANYSIFHMESTVLPMITLLLDYTESNLSNFLNVR